MSQTPNTEPSMGPTRPTTLLVAALAAAAVAWLAVSEYYYDLPPFPWAPAAALGALAVAEVFVAQSTKARIDRKPGQERIDPLLVARLVVLAKASSLAASIFAGFYAGITLWLAIERQRNAHPAEDLPAVIAGLVASTLLVIAALWLERSCRIPEQPEETDKMPSDQGS